MPSTSADKPQIVTVLNAADIPPDDEDVSFPSAMGGAAFNGLAGEFVKFVLPRDGSGARGTAPHINLIGHITREELRHRMRFGPH